MVPEFFLHSDSSDTGRNIDTTSRESKQSHAEFKGLVQNKSEVLAQLRNQELEIVFSEEGSVSDWVCEMIGNSDLGRQVRQVTIEASIAP